MTDFNGKRENETICEMTISELPAHLKREFGVTQHADAEQVIYVKYVNGSATGVFESLDDALES